MRKPPGIVNREYEWNQLVAAWQRPRPELVLVLGRRRAGKSFLLSQFAESVGGLYYQATRRTEGEQLRHLAEVVGRQVDPGLQRAVSFRDWEGFLDYVTERAAAAPFLLVLDEFTYLTDAASALPSILQAYWDHRWRDTQLKVVLSGSHITAMRQLEAANQPLYGRRTVRLEVHPFDYLDASAFLPEYSVRERLEGYGIFGGLPGHLASLEAGVSLKENVARHLLHPAGRLVDDAQHMLDAFLKDARDHYSVIEAVANGDQTYSAITSRTGLRGASAQRAFQWLQQMRIMEKVVPITERNPAKSKRGIYRIVDPYVGFWHRFVGPLVNAGSIGIATGERLWADHIERELDSYMGPVFEASCRAFVRRATHLPFRPTRIGSWWDARSENEIDVVAVGGRGSVLAGECKWGRLHSSDLTRLRARAHTLLTELGAPDAELTLALFAAGPVHEMVRTEAAAGRVMLFTLDDLYGRDLAPQV